MPGVKAYGVLANVFIGREAEIYQQNASKTGGWGRDPRVSHREENPRAASLSPALSSNRLMASRSPITSLASTWPSG